MKARDHRNGLVILPYTLGIHAQLACRCWIHSPSWLSTLDDYNYTPSEIGLRNISYWVVDARALRRCHKDSRGCRRYVGKR